MRALLAAQRDATAAPADGGHEQPPVAHEG